MFIIQDTRLNVLINVTFYGFRKKTSPISLQIFEDQYGFRPTGSITVALIKLIHDVYGVVDFITLLSTVSVEWWAM